MKFLIVDTYYPAFLRRVYAKDPHLEQCSYADQHSALMAYLFGTSDFYSRNLRELGHEAEELVVNCTPLQSAWIEEHGPGQRSGRVGSAKWEAIVFSEQVRRTKPDVLFLQNITYFEPQLLASLREHCAILASQTAYPLDWSYPLDLYDVIFTSFPHYADRFRMKGIAAEHLRIAFEPRVLDEVREARRDVSVSFIGGFSERHRGAFRPIEHLAQTVPVDVWGYGGAQFLRNSPPALRYHGEAWGVDMYRLLARSHITLNRHIDVAGRFANNMRLYEATGVGACLVTDVKDNLPELFDVGTEVVAYEGAEDLVEKVTYLLEHEGERAAIAEAGQRRTLRDHNYKQRMEELADYLETYLRKPRKPTEWTFRSTRSVVSRTSARALRGAQRAVRGTPLEPVARWALRHLRFRSRETVAISTAHELVARDEMNERLIAGWKDPSIPDRQRRVVDEELSRMYRGDVVPVYRIAAEAVSATEIEDLLVIEVGCASAYYSEVLSYLLGRKMRYIGADYSAALIHQGHEYYPNLPLVAGDATALPFGDSSCDILFSPAVIMHVPDYQRAIEESARVAGRFCIFHRTPVVQAGPTTYLKKMAYGVPVVELVFAEEELLATFKSASLELIRVFDVDQARVEGIPGVVEIKTYLCRKL